MVRDRNLNKIEEPLKELDATYIFFNNSYKGLCRYIKILLIL